MYRPNIVPMLKIVADIQSLSTIEGYHDDTDRAAVAMVGLRNIIGLMGAEDFVELGVVKDKVDLGLTPSKLLAVVESIEHNVPGLDLGTYKRLVATGELNAVLLDCMYSEIDNAIIGIMLEQVHAVNLNDADSVEEFVSAMGNHYRMVLRNNGAAPVLIEVLLKAFTEDVVADNMDKPTQSVPTEEVNDVLAGDEPTASQVLYVFKLLEKLTNHPSPDLVNQVAEELYGSDVKLTGDANEFDMAQPLLKGGVEYLLAMFKATRGSDLLMNNTMSEGSDFAQRVETYARVNFGVILSSQKGPLYFLNCNTFKDKYLTFLDNCVRNFIEGLLKSRVKDDNFHDEIAREIVGYKYNTLVNQGLDEAQITTRMERFNDIS